MARVAGCVANCARGETDYEGEGGMNGIIEYYEDGTTLVVTWIR